LRRAEYARRELLSALANGSLQSVATVLKAGLIYFLLVFGAGFALAFIRLPFLVPRFGIRIAELMEAPVMLAVIVWASRRLAHRTPDLTRLYRLLAGVFALTLLVTAELILAYLLDNRSPSQYIASRDPISGSVYILSLAFFAVAPALWITPPPTRPQSSP
jgi:hypothetical protein